MTTMEQQHWSNGLGRENFCTVDILKVACFFCFLHTERLFKLTTSIHQIHSIDKNVALLLDSFYHRFCGCMGEAPTQMRVMSMYPLQRQPTLIPNHNQVDTCRYKLIWRMLETNGWNW